MLSPPTDYKPPCLRKRIQKYSVFSRSYISTWSYEGKPSIQDKRANVIYVMTFPSIWLASKSPCCGELTTGTSEQSPEAGRWDKDNSRLVSAWQHTGNYWQLGLATLAQWAGAGHRQKRGFFILIDSAVLEDDISDGHLIMPTTVRKMDTFLSEAATWHLYRYV